MSGQRPDLQCLLQHWYECRPSGEVIGPRNNTRFQDIMSLHALQRQIGVEGLRALTLSALRGERAFSPTYLLVGAGLWPEEEAVRRRVRVALWDMRREDYCIAATYAAVYYLDVTEVACILTERVVVAQVDSLVVLASNEALSIGSDFQQEGACRRCGAKLVGPSSTRRLQALVRTPASSKSP